MTLLFPCGATMAYYSLAGLRFRENWSFRACVSKKPCSKCWALSRKHKPGSFNFLGSTNPQNTIGNTIGHRTSKCKLNPDAVATILHTLRSISPSQGLVRLVPKWKHAQGVSIVRNSTYNNTECIARDYRKTRRNRTQMNTAQVSKNGPWEC